MDVSHELYVKTFNGLPPPLRSFLVDPEMGQILQETSNRYALHVDAAGVLATLTSYMLMGLASPTQTLESLKEAGVSPDNAQKIMSDLNEKIFIPLREKVRTYKEQGEGIEITDSRPAEIFTQTTSVMGPAQPNPSAPPFTLEVRTVPQPPANLPTGDSLFPPTTSVGAGTAGPPTSTSATITGPLPAPELTQAGTQITPAPASPEAAHPYLPPRQMSASPAAQIYTPKTPLESQAPSIPVTPSFAPPVRTMASDIEEVKIHPQNSPTFPWSHPQEPAIPETSSFEKFKIQQAAAAQITTPTPQQIATSSPTPPPTTAPPIVHEYSVDPYREPPV